MTNEQIIYNQQLELLKRGVIGTTGRIIHGQDEQGNKVEIEEPEPIHTYVGWRAHGYQVKKDKKQWLHSIFGNVGRKSKRKKIKKQRKKSICF